MGLTPRIRRAGSPYGLTRRRSRRSDFERRTAMRQSQVPPPRAFIPRASASTAAGLAAERVTIAARERARRLAMIGRRPDADAKAAR
jgi:hypothetical protein